MIIRKFAAVDIGSNAVRLLIKDIFLENKTAVKSKKSNFIRFPIRLGEDAFSSGKISDINRQRLVYAMKGIHYVMKVHGVEKYLAYATSAMREAENGPDVVETVRKESNIAIDIIDGQNEANLIASTVLLSLIEQHSGIDFLHADIGGGSVELIFYQNEALVCARSFKVGTVRSLKNAASMQSVFLEMKKWIKDNVISTTKINIIGTGGNVNRLFKMSGEKYGSPMSLKFLDKTQTKLTKMTFDERVSTLRMNLDRADVIIPALEILVKICKWSGAEKIHVPKLGLADGMISYIYESEGNGHPVQ